MDNLKANLLVSFLMSDKLWAADCSISENPESADITIKGSTYHVTPQTNIHILASKTMVRLGKAESTAKCIRYIENGVLLHNRSRGLFAEKGVSR